AMDRELVSDSLVYRYNPGASPDGLAGDEGTFSLCTFWYVEALARAGRLDEARLVFAKMHTYANHLGLYSEEIGSTGEQLGNFPQAVSRLALISAAVNLHYQLDHGAGSDDRARPAGEQRPVPARLVPVHRVDAATGEVRLRCTLAEFGQLDRAEDIEVIEDLGDAGGALTGMGVGTVRKRVRTVVHDAVPVGESEVRRGEPV